MFSYWTKLNKPDFCLNNNLLKPTWELQFEFLEVWKFLELFLIPTNKSSMFYFSNPNHKFSKKTPFLMGKNIVLDTHQTTRYHIHTDSSIIEAEFSTWTVSSVSCKSALWAPGTGNVSTWTGNVEPCLTAVQLISYIYISPLLPSALSWRVILQLSSAGPNCLNKVFTKSRLLPCLSWGWRYRKVHGV